MEFEFLIDGKKEKVALETGKGVFKIVGPDGVIDIDVKRISDNCLSLLHGGRSRQVFYARDKEGLLLWVGRGLV